MDISASLDSSSFDRNMKQRDGIEGPHSMNTLMLSASHFPFKKLRESKAFKEPWEIEFPLDALSTRRCNRRFGWWNKLDQSILVPE
jgi:hypothetical protein